ncbi:methylated-DNA--[protein]-cysteine S-methyltransferase [Oscillospiraceae bacterium N12]|jgi:AraC family transcriptional regulator of adaptative response/methylated-DNA-[protein]-cysteine methyltransferase|uniref:methylated-DNA--[protein]-cysteine S-methyltransferase n=1 Tax=Jilunia laotingensis TaxID=2763675 RepID=A0A926F587_9BACT|nr:methylated-DNA--[protein]-cysteine S-methyltransferase [Jilunia laotingensis]MBC8594230.1 methylated-DNA--[protein]-cysteine S-methyltransferase [Jilunia laotingensis]
MGESLNFVRYGEGTSHEHFISIERMSNEECGVGGRNLSISYNFESTSFMDVLVASTTKGVCYMAFADEREKALEELASLFPMAAFERRSDKLQEHAVAILNTGCEDIKNVKLYVKASDFQLKVWNTLLKIPLGALTTYGDIARYLHSPKASRAVGTAVGDNPVAFLIPCHRVVRSDGTLGGYHWGLTRKTAIIDWEAKKCK